MTQRRQIGYEASDDGLFSLNLKMKKGEPGIIPGSLFVDDIVSFLEWNEDEAGKAMPCLERWRLLETSQ